MKVMLDRRNLVIYHRVDYDGIFSGCIAEKSLESRGMRVEVLGWNYSDPLPDIQKLKNQYATITMVDISFPADVMLDLRDTWKLTWIDHHITAIDDSIKFGYSDIPGLRKIGLAACELCWNFYYPHSQVPQLIQMLSSYDVWNKDRFNWEDDIMPLQYGLKTRYGINYQKIYADFDYLLSRYDEVLDDGFAVYSYLKDTWKSWAKNCSFEVLVDRKYKGICMLSPMSGSSCFQSVSSQYEVYLVANIRNNGQVYSLSMYKDSPDIIPEFSCGEYLKQFGGGGHSSAAGSDISKEVFSRLIFEHQI